MRQLVVLNHLTLDGVMQAPGRSNEDPRGGFEYGCWAAQNVDEVMGRTLGERMGEGGGLLLGRCTYEQMYAYWPKQGDDNRLSRLGSTSRRGRSRSRCRGRTRRFSGATRRMRSPRSRPTGTGA